MSNDTEREKLAKLIRRTMKIYSYIGAGILLFIGIVAFLVLLGVM